MATTERYQIDYFAIVVLIVTVLVMVFLIIASVYFYNLINLKPPTPGEASFLFWTSIVLAVMFLFLFFYALWRIFTHTVTVYEATVVPVVVPPVGVRQVVEMPPKVVVTREVTTTTANPVQVVQSAPVVTREVTVTTTNPVAVTNQVMNPVKISNIPVTTRQTEFSTSVSDIPVSVQQRNALQAQLINLQGSMA